MSEPLDEQLEQAVADYVARREQDPGLTPERFASERDGGPELMRALKGALDALELLGDGGDPLPDRNLGPYRVIREIGRGGMGVVYEVERGGHRYALKRLWGAAISHTQGLQRFEREMRVLARIDHPGVVKIQEAFTDQGVPHLVMELVDGSSLEGMGPMPWQPAVKILADVAEAVAAIHGEGVCHRDLKPQNVLMREGRPVVVDFGLVHDREDVTLTRSGDVLGTPRYVAPEQANGRATDATADVYTLGLMLVELISGRPARPFEDRAQLMTAARSGAWSREGLRVLPPGLHRILRVALAVEPRRRFRDAGEMAADLERLLAGQRVRARPPSWFARARDRIAARPHTAAAVGVGLLLLVTAAGIGYASAVQAAKVRADLARATAAWLAGDEAVARRHALAVLEREPEEAGAIALLASVGSAPRWPPGEHARWLRAALADLDRGAGDAAKAACTAAIDLRPSCPVGWAMRARASELAGDAAAAVADLATVANLLPESATMLFVLGRARIKTEDFARAAGTLRRGVDLDPRSWRLRRELARALHDVDPATGLDEVEQANRLMTESGETGEAFADLRNLEATLLDKLGRPDEAIVILRELAEQDPDDPKYCFNLAYALDRQMEVAEARDLYERVLQRDAEHRSANLCLIWLLATAEDHALRDLDRAEQLMLAVLRRDRGRSDAVISMVREFGLRTRRIDGIRTTLEELAADEGTSDALRDTLRHTSQFLANAVGR